MDEFAPDLPARSCPTLLASARTVLCAPPLRLSGQQRRKQALTRLAQAPPVGTAVADAALVRVNRMPPRGRALGRSMSVKDMKAERDAKLAQREAEKVEAGVVTSPRVADLHGFRRDIELGWVRGAEFA